MSVQDSISLHIIRLLLSHSLFILFFFFFFFNDTATTEIYTLSLHDALPISPARFGSACRVCRGTRRAGNSARASGSRSEEHTSELQSRSDLVCRLLLEKKKKKNNTSNTVLTKHRPQDECATTLQ